MALFESLADIANRARSSIGVTDLSPFPETESRIESRIAEGLDGGLSFTYAHSATATKPAESFPWASSIVAVAFPYLGEGDGPNPDRTVARFADGDRYAGLRAVLDAIADKLEENGFRAQVVFDDDRLVDRAVAARAGVAWEGKSTMVLSPGAGPWVLLGSVVTSAALAPTPPMKRSCGTCVACLPACPTDAIIAPGVLDVRRCISAVLQRRGAIDPMLREAIGGRIYGCDDCLTACPPGHRSLEGVSGGGGAVDAAGILRMNDRELAAIVDHWYVPSRSMRFVRRNALVALGNTGDTSSLGLLAGYVGHPDPLLAGHAAWALGRIGGQDAATICETALDSRREESVREELVAAVAASRRGRAYAEVLPMPRTVDSEEISS